MNPFRDFTLEALRQVPVVRRLREARFDREFAKGNAVGTFRGIYDTFEDALADLPSGSPTSYDQPGTGDMYKEVLTSLREWDYPVLYWLSRYPGTLRSVFDYGGHVGFLYYGFAKYLSFAPDLEWMVCDVPEVTRAGQRLAKERGDGRIDFCNELKTLERGYDVLLASGSLQYLEEPLYETLEKLEAVPSHLIINMLPLHPRREFVTVNSMEASYCAYKVFQLPAFLAGMRKAGWELKDSWENPGKACRVDFHEEFSDSRYYGMYYVRS